MRRRQLSTFSLSFIDSILCGFGAVILLFLTVNANSLAHRHEVTEDLRGEVIRLEQEILQGRKHLASLRNALEQTEEEQRRFEGLSRQLIITLEEKQVQLATFERENLARKQHLNRLKADLKSEEQGTKRLKAGATSAPVQEGERLREFPGEGDRQYLTDLKVGGRHILILVDASASMLGESLVDIIRRRNLSDAEKIQARKWRRAVATVDWLTTQLPVSSKFQIYIFNETAAPIIQGTDTQWLNAGNPGTLNEAVDNLRKVVPRKGTSLHHAFVAVKTMRPRPDNIFLLTDGLPTRGKSKSWGNKVSGEQRLAHYARALKELPSGIPVNIILYPMEGDPGAAAAFWKLAQTTKGSFFSPSKDWP